MLNGHRVLVWEEAKFWTDDADGFMAKRVLDITVLCAAKWLEVTDSQGQ